MGNCPPKILVSVNNWGKTGMLKILRQEIPTKKKTDSVLYPRMTKMEKNRKKIMKNGKKIDKQMTKNGKKIDAKSTEKRHANAEKSRETNSQSMIKIEKRSKRILN